MSAEGIQRAVTYTPESIKVRCSVCRRKAVCEILGVELGPFGAHWLRLPYGWWMSMGLRLDDLRRGGAGSIRCPQCFAKTQQIATESTQQ